MVTRDRGFGSLVFLSRMSTQGVVFLRIEPKSQEQVHGELKTLLAVHEEDELRECFCTVEAGRHRLRRLP